MSITDASHRVVLRAKALAFLVKYLHLAIGKPKYGENFYTKSVVFGTGTPPGSAISNLALAISWSWVKQLYEFP